MKLTKNTVRFSKLIRPEVGTTVDFSPVVILCKNTFTADTREFLCDYMIEGAKCKVIKNTEETVTVEFDDAPQTEDKATFIRDLVSPEFLIKRDLTDEAIKMLNELKRKMGINY